MKTLKKWDVNYVRQQFPALNDAQPNKVSFFENAGGTYVPNQVIDHLTHFLVNNKVQPYGPYQASLQGTAAIEKATVKMAEMINSDEDEVVIGHCTTMNLYMLVMALRKNFSEGDEIIVTEQDHEANISPWLKLQEFGVVIKFWPIDSQTGRLSLKQLNSLLSDRTRLVCVTHSSNIVGDVNPIKTIADMVHKVGGLLLVDGVSYAPHHAIDVKALDVDIYVLSLYKVFGPHLGLMYVKRNIHRQLESQYFEQLPKLYQQYKAPGSPNFLRIALNPGLVNHEEVASLLGLVAYFDDLYYHHGFSENVPFHQRMCAVMALAIDHETQLAHQWLSWLDKQPLLSLVGCANPNVKERSPTWALHCHSLSPQVIAKQLSIKNIAVQSGSFYAWHCIDKLGVGDEGLLRVSLAHFNNSEEVAHLCASLEQILAKGIM